MDTRASKRKRASENGSDPNGDVDVMSLVCDEQRLMSNLVRIGLLDAPIASRQSDDSIQADRATNVDAGDAVDGDNMERQMDNCSKNHDDIGDNEIVANLSSSASTNSCNEIDFCIRKLVSIFGYYVCIGSI